MKEVIGKNMLMKNHETVIEWKKFNNKEILKRKKKCKKK